MSNTTPKALTPRKLTLKQQRFIRYYLETGNGAEAVRLAGYQLGSKGGSKANLSPAMVASNIAVENLKKPYIKQQIDKQYVKENIYAERVLRNIDKIATEAEADRDKLKANELLGKHLNIFSESDKKETNINIVLAFDSPKKEIIDQERTV